MAEFSLGEAIGLRGRFTQAEQVSGYAANALANAAKARAARAKADQELFEDINKSITPPKDLHPLYQQPAQEFTGDFLSQLRNYKREGSLSSRGYRLVDEYSQLMSEINSKSDRMKEFDEGYKSASTYKSKAQRDLKALSVNSRNIYDFSEKVRQSKIPGYNPDEYDFTTVNNQPSMAIFQQRRDIESDIKDRMYKLTEVNIPPSGITVDGQDMIQYGSQVFFTKKQAEDWQRSNPEKEIPITVEDQVDAIMQDDEFLFQFADQRNLDFEDMGVIKKELMDMAKGYATEEISYKNKTRDTNIYLNTAEQPAMYETKLVGTLQSINPRQSSFELAGVNMSGYSISSDKLNATPGTVDDNGVKVQAPLVDATLSNTMIVPTVVGVGGVEKPVIKNTSDFNSIDPKDIHSFRLYTVFVTGSGQRRYVPYSEAQSQLEISKLPNDQLARFNNEISKQQRLESKLIELHKQNKNNSNFELYKNINLYLESKSLDSQEPLNKYLESLIN